MLYLVLLLFLLAGGILVVITVQNLITPVHFVLVAWQTPDIPLGFLVLVAFLLGALLLFLVAFLSAWNDKRDLRALQARIDELEEQATRQRIANIPTMPRGGNAAMQIPSMFMPPEH